MEPIDIRGCLDFNLKLMTFSSVRPTDIGSSPTVNKLYNAFTKITLLVFFIITSGVLPWLFYTDYNLEDLIEVISIMITQLRCLTRFLTFIVFRKDIRNLISTLYDNFNIHGRELDPQERLTISNTMENCRKITKYYVGLFCCTGISMVIQPLTAPEPEELEDHSNNSLPHKPLPFKAYYFINTAESPQYELVYIAQSYLALVESWGIGSLDSFCVVILMFVTCQYELLYESLRNMKRNIAIRMQIMTQSKIIAFQKRVRTAAISDEGIEVHEDRNLSQDETQPPVVDLYRNVECNTDMCLVEDEINTYISKCIIHHQAMLKYVEDFNVCFRPMFFSILLTASILMCMMGFQVIVIPPKGIMFVRVVLHLLCTIFELGFFCWFGSDVMRKSASLCDAAYFSEWEDLPSSAKKNICMIILRSQQPVGIDAGLFGSLCLPLFGTMMKNAYSYLALLKQLHEGDIE